MPSELYRRKADTLLQQAAGASNMKERGALIDEALHWHNLALDASDHDDGRANDNGDVDTDSDEAARG